MRVLYIVLGLLFLALGTVGIVPAAPADGALLSSGSVLPGQGLTQA